MERKCYDCGHIEQDDRAEVCEQCHSKRIFTEEQHEEIVKQREELKRKEKVCKESKFKQCLECGVVMRRDEEFCLHCGKDEFRIYDPCLKCKAITWQKLENFCAVCREVDLKTPNISLNADGSTRAHK